MLPVVTSLHLLSALSLLLRCFSSPAFTLSPNSASALAHLHSPTSVFISVWVLAWFLVDSSIAILHCWKGVIQRKVCKSLENGPRLPPQESWHLLQLLKVSELPTQLWPLRSFVSGVLDGWLWCKCMEVTFSQENSQIHLGCCWWSWKSNWKEKNSWKVEQMWLWDKEHLCVPHVSLSSVLTL